MLVWFNGGPGASSLFGFMAELGPFMFNDDSKKCGSFNTTGIPCPIANEYGWTKVASLLAISGPPPVGFSYCDAGGVSGDGYSCGDWDDTRTAIANKDALVSWAKEFPEFAGREMYIAGESYAGKREQDTATQPHLADDALLLPLLQVSTSQRSYSRSSPTRRAV